MTLAGKRYKKPSITIIHILSQRNPLKTPRKLAKSKNKNGKSVKQYN